MRAGHHAVESRIHTRVHVCASRWRALRKTTRHGNHTDTGGATYGEIIKKAKMKRPHPESGAPVYTESSSSEEEEEIVVKRKKKSSSKKKKRRIVYVEASSSEDESPHLPQPDDEAMSPLRPWGLRGYFAVRR